MHRFSTMHGSPPHASFCSHSKPGFKAAVDAWSEIADLDGLVGFACSIVCQPVALLAAAWNIPMVSFLCSSSLLSDKEVYPTFTRTSVNWVALFPGAFAATLHAFGSVTQFSLHFSRLYLTPKISKLHEFNRWCDEPLICIYVAVILLRLIYLYNP